VQQTAALALGRLAHYSTELATELVTTRVLQELVHSMKAETATIYHRRAGAYVVRAVSRHTPELAQCCVDAGAAAVLVACLEDQDAGVREASAQSLGVVASHTAELAEAVVEAGAIPLLAASLKEPEPSLKRACIVTLTELAKHAPELVEPILEASIPVQLSALLAHDDARVRRQVCACLAQMAKHTVELAEMLVEAAIFPALLGLLQDADAGVQRNAAVAVREVVKHADTLSALVVQSQGVGHLVDFMQSSLGAARLPGVMALGFIASYSETLAMDVLSGAGATAVCDALINEPEDHVKAAAVWALGQMGKHGAEHARLLAEADCLRHMLGALVHEEASGDLRAKAGRALLATLPHCTHLPAMLPLLPAAPRQVQRAVLAQVARVVPSDAAQRRQLVAGGGLKAILALETGGDAGVEELLDAISDAYPVEVVEFCSPGYSKTLATATFGEEGKDDLHAGTG
jgi:3-methyladenine DNA glycosylase AlkD